MNAGQQAADAAIDRVKQGANDEWWTAAYNAGCRLAETRRAFTSADVFDSIPSTFSTPEPRAMGAIMRRLASEGFIAPSDNYAPGRASNHGRPQRVWFSKLIAS